MASISNIVLAATKTTESNTQWRITVTYDAGFSAFEQQNFRFRDGFRVMEDDGGGDIEILTGVVGISTFDPSGPVVHRTMTATVSTDTLATESGPEELFVEVRLRNLDLNVLETKKSKTLLLHPDV